MKEEFEKHQRGNTLANTLTGGGASGFDAAAWLAGSNNEAAEVAVSKSTPAEAKSGSGGGGKSRRRG